MSQFYFLSGLTIALQIYAFFALQSLVKAGTPKWIFIIGYVLLSILVIYSIYNMYSAIQARNIFSSTQFNFNIGVVITALVTLVFFGAMMLTQDVARLGIGAWNAISGALSDSADKPAQMIPGRRNFLTWAATLIAAVPFSAMIYGITRGKYNFKVSEVSINFPNLPKAFDGFKIVQISDIHSGSLDDLEQVAKGVALINEQKPDLITFTGDLVNSDKNEVDPFINTFKQLESKHGTYAVLGNHDYYGTYRIEKENEPAYWDDFFAKYASMGMTLLNNASVKIEKDGESIQLTGVENWGAGRWFPKKGDLDKALKDVDNDAFTVLMSHDPTHWEEKVIGHPKKIDLTLSGHTHGMQFGINMPGFKWSPAQMRYKHWMGLYNDADQYLYVNRGFGFLAFPGRVGMWPEITVIELKAV